MPTRMLIVESAAKARTIQKYLGDDWVVMATGGHVQTLPSGREHGKDGSKAMWANQPGALPRPPWVWSERGEKAMGAIFERAQRDRIGAFFLASDPDREGEFIAWRLAELLADRGKVHRVTFDEVTRAAVERALAHPRPVDHHLVDSAQVRMFVDRLVGFRTSKIARARLTGGGKASMGRVQTPTLGFVVERELEREAHVPIRYFEVRVRAASVPLTVRFSEPDAPEVWRDDEGKAVPTRTGDGDLAQQALSALKAAGEVRIDEARQGSTTRRPRPPLSTDGLLQDAGGRWSWSPGRTMRVATALYEAGHITYIRTDSTRLSEDFTAAARRAIEERWGEDHLGPGAQARAPAGKVQDAHEAIRPTDISVESIADLDEDEQRLYRLIRARALASQMSSARFARVSLSCRAEGLEPPLTGTVSWRVHAGYQAAFAGLDKEPPEAPPEVSLEVGATLVFDAGDPEAPNPTLVDDVTKPPPRLRPHTLVRQMKESGIGRPSTYASTVEKLLERRYVVSEDGALVPTDRGRSVWLEIAPLYEQDDDDLFSVAYTSAMESILDRVEAGEEPAAEVWERLRDRVRALHEAAREHLNSGAAPPHLLAKLLALLDRAPEGVEGPADPAALTLAEARGLIQELQQLGVEPPPTPEQLGFIATLAEDLQIGEGEAAALVGAETFAHIPTLKRASALIEMLKERLREERPASPKQLAMIRKLTAEVGLDEAAAAALVGSGGLDDLGGGRDGTASALIDLLLERRKKARAPSPPSPQQ